MDWASVGPLCYSFSLPKKNLIDYTWTGLCRVWMCSCVAERELIMGLCINCQSALAKLCVVCTEQQIFTLRRSIDKQNLELVGQQSQMKDLQSRLAFLRVSYDHDSKDPDNITSRADAMIGVADRPDEPLYAHKVILVSGLASGYLYI